MFPHIVKTIVHPDEGLVEKIMSDGTVRKGPGNLHSKGARSSYRQTRIDGRLVYVHRLIWEHVHGPIPDDQEIDHINLDRGDNRITNLRLVTHKQNGENLHHTRTNNKSGIKGVSWSAERRKWVAGIGHLGRYYPLGRFTTIEEAQAAYAGAAALLHTHNPHAAL